MSDLTQAQFYDALLKLREGIQKDFQEAHGRIRTDMDEGFAHWGQKFETHVHDDLAVKDRVLVIETERKEEAKQATKRAGLVSLIVAGGVSAFVEALKRTLFGGH